MIKRISAVAYIGLIFGALIFLTNGCAGCEGGVEGTGTGEIQTTPSEIAFSTVAVGDSQVEILSLRNVSSEESLTIRDMELIAGDNGHIDQLQLLDVPSLPVELEAGEEVLVDVEYSPESDSPRNRGVIVIDNSDPQYHDGALEVDVRTLGNDPEIFIEPPVVRFQRMQPGESSTQSVQITNIGDGPMTIFEEPVYSGGEDFSIQVPSRDFPVELEPFSSTGSVETPDDYILDIEVDYRPEGEGADTGSIQVEADDVENPPAAEGESEIHEIDVVADAEAPCIEVDGRTRDFGQVPLGEIGRETIAVSNCGTEDLEIDTIALEDDDGEVFYLNLGAWDQSGDGNLDGTVELSPDESDSFIVEFNPLEEGTERADLRINSNDPVQPSLTLNLVARGAEGSCPEAVALASIEGTPMQPNSSITAAPLEYIVLDGTDSNDDDGDVVDWQWEVLEDPPGTTIEVEPTQDDLQDQDQSMRRFQPLTAGTYRIGLNVVDDSGFQSCNQSEVTVTAIPDQNIHVELTWTNPADPEETDSDGSDLDLHLTKMGPGEWFVEPYSIWYLHKNSSEEPIWNSEDPSLDIDVTDGLGPENITMRTPADCQWYSVGVHYYDEVFGTAYATVRIYINGDLRYERPYFALESSNEFWDVARIHWDDDDSDATIVGVDEFYGVQPAEEPPEVTDEMIQTERCTAENLY